jgi:hypothetical protein
MTEKIETVLAEIEARASLSGNDDVLHLVTALRLAMDGPEVDEDRQVLEGAWDRFEAEIAGALRGEITSDSGVEPERAPTHV